jgi:hypothetical protein
VTVDMTPAERRALTDRLVVQDCSTDLILRANSDEALLHFLGALGPEALREYDRKSVQDMADSKLAFEAQVDVGPWRVPRRDITYTEDNRPVVTFPGLALTVLTPLVRVSPEDES